MSKRSRTKPVDIEITFEQLQSFGNQLGLEFGPLSPIVEARLEGPPEPVTDTNLVNKRGKPLPSVVSAFMIMAKPEVASSLVLIAPDSVVDVAIFYRSQNSEEHSAALHKGEQTLKLLSPAHKNEILARIHNGLDAAAFAETPIELDARASTGGGWVLWSLMDLLRPTDGEVPKAAEKGFSTKQILESMEAPVQGVWNLAAYYRHALELSLPTKAEVNGWCEELAIKGFLEKSKTRWKAAILLRAVAEDLFPLRSHLHFKMSAQAPEGGIGSLRFWGLQGDSGTCLLWHALPDETQMLSTSTMNVMGILRKMIDQPAFVFSSEADILDLPTAPDDITLASETLIQVLARPAGLPGPPERLFPSAPPEKL